MRLATILTNMDGINHNFFENHHSYGYIFRALAEEKASGILLIIEQIDSGTCEWLTRKGFQTDEDIKELTKLVGSLAEGLLVLLVSLDRRAQGKVGIACSRKGRVVTERKYSKELLTAVRKLRQEKVQENFFGTDLEEDGYDKLPAVARISISRQSSYQPTDGREGQEDDDGELEDNPEEPSDDPASTMEISLDITDEPKIAITEVYDMIDSQQLNNSKTAAGKRVHPYTARLLHKLYDGGLFSPHKVFKRNQYTIEVHRNTITIYIPTWINLDPERSATVKAELADRGTKLPETKIFARNDKASDIARRLGISVTVFTKGGSKIQFWAKKRSAKAAGYVHDLIVALEAFQEEEAIESSQ
jgi:hypothetical protein